MPLISPLKAFASILIEGFIWKRQEHLIFVAPNYYFSYNAHVQRCNTHESVLRLSNVFSFFVHLNKYNMYMICGIIKFKLKYKGKEGLNSCSKGWNAYSMVVSKEWNALLTIIRLKTL